MTAVPTPEVPASEVIVDDRLATVLATVPAGHAGARTQYRQLLDLLGRTPPDFALPAAASERLALLDEELGADERAQLIRALPGSLRHPGLILRLAGQSPVVAAAAISAARLDDWQWSALTLELPLAARGHLRHRRDLGPRTRAVLGRLGILDLGLPSPAAAPAPAAARGIAAAPPPPSPAEGADGIAAILTRIEAFRRSRQSGTRQFAEGRPVLAEAAPRLPLGEPGGETHDHPKAIRFTATAAGRISAADTPWSPMLAGLALGRRDDLSPARCDERSARAFRQRRPIHAGRITIDGAATIAGAWRIDATPCFDSEGGRFLGYRGVLRRPEQDDTATVDGIADRLRQLLHELRTPVNAIQGFAELIQQQLFGPTPHQYRSLAASIAADSAAVLAGFEEIEQLVRFETGHGEEPTGECDLASVLVRLLGQLRQGMSARGAAFAFEAAGPVAVALPETAVERVLWRVLAMLATEALPGETLPLELAVSGDAIVLAVPLPQAMAERGDDALFGIAPVAAGAGPFLGLLGGGFALRLARAEARGSNGDLERDGPRLLLRLPGLTPLADANSSEPGFERSIVA